MVITRSKLAEMQAALKIMECCVQLERIPIGDGGLLGVHGDALQLRHALPVLGRYLPPADLRELNETPNGDLTIFLNIEVEDSFAFMPTSSAEN